MSEAMMAGSVEQELLDYVRRLERNPYDWHAIHLHLSQLKPHNRRSYQLRLAANEFDGLLRQYSSELFQIASGDIFFIWQGGSVDEVDKVVLRLRYLFSDDPLLHAPEQPEQLEDLEALIETTGGSEQPRFCDWYELERDYDGLRLALEVLLENMPQEQPSAVARPLDPLRLANVEASIADADLSAFMRRQPICAILPKAQPQPIFSEVHIAVGELANRIMPGVDPTADPWLFQHLAETLDRRMLALLGDHPEAADAGRLSINLRLATVLSPEFLNFDARLRSHYEHEVIVELQLIDIFAEFGSYLFIREFIRERGYRICIDGLHHLHLPLINRRRLGADLVKLIWSPDLLGALSQQRQDDLQAAIKQTGVDRIILCRCDSSDAVQWGQAMGIRLFQGHYVDSRLRAARSPAVAAARKAMRQAGSQ